MKMLNNYFQSHIVHTVQFVQYVYNLYYCTNKKIKEIQECGSKHFLSWKVLNWSTVKTWCVAAVSTHLLTEQPRGNSNFEDPWWQLEVERVKTCENVAHFLAGGWLSHMHIRKLPSHPHLFIYFVNSTSNLSASTPPWSSASSSLESFLGIISLWKDLLCPL